MVSLPHGTMTATDNLDFVPKPITSAAIRLGDGSNICVAMAAIQRVAALRAYKAFSEQGDWLQKFSHAYVVALATRSADSLLMKVIQEKLNELLPISCRQCRESTYGSALIRKRLFPSLQELRAHANALIHHLDEPGNKGGGPCSTLRLSLTTATVYLRSILMRSSAPFLRHTENFRSRRASAAIAIELRSVRIVK